MIEIIIFETTKTKRTTGKTTETAKPKGEEIKQKMMHHKEVLLSLINNKHKIEQELLNNEG